MFRLITRSRHNLRLLYRTNVFKIQLFTGALKISSLSQQIDEFHFRIQNIRLNIRLNIG